MHQEPHHQEYLICLIGYPLSSKTVVGAELVKNLGATLVPTKELLLEYAPETTQTVHGAGVVQNDIMIPVLENHWPEQQHGPIFVVDALRDPGQVDWLAASRPDAKIIAVELVVSKAEIYRRRAKAKNTERGDRPDDTIEKLTDRIVAADKYMPTTKAAFRRRAHVYKTVVAQRPAAEVASEVLDLCVRSGMELVAAQLA